MITRGRITRGWITRGRITRGEIKRGRITRGRITRGGITRGRITRGRLLKEGRICYMRSYPTKLPSDSVNAELPAFFFLFSILYEKGEGRQVAQHKLGFCAKTPRKSPVAQKSANALLSIRDGLPISRAIMEQFNFSLYCSFVIFCL